MPVLVEFFGLPGAGKSTLSKELTDRLGKDFVNTSDLLWDDRGTFGRRINKLRLFLMCNLNSEYRPLLRQALRLRQSSIQNRIKAVSPLATFFLIRSMFKEKNQNAVFDQGVLQSLYSLIYASVDEHEASKAISKLIKWSVKSQQIHVIVETPAETCRMRVRDRSNNHSRLSSDDDANWDRSVEYFDRIKSRLLSRLDEDELETRVLVVNGLLPVEENANQIAHWIQEVLADCDT